MSGKIVNYVTAKESVFRAAKLLIQRRWSKHFHQNQIDAQASQVRDEKKDGGGGGDGGDDGGGEGKTCNYVAQTNNRKLQVAPGGLFLQNIIDFLWELATSLGRRICKKVKRICLSKQM